MALSQSSPRHEEQSLPDELLSLVGEFLSAVERLETLANLAQTSKTQYRKLLPLLYQTIPFSSRRSYKLLLDLPFALASSNGANVDHIESDKGLQQALHLAKEYRASTCHCDTAAVRFRLIKRVRFEVFIPPRILELLRTLDLPHDHTTPFPNLENVCFGGKLFFRQGYHYHDVCGGFDLLFQSMEPLSICIHPTTFGSRCAVGLLPAGRVEQNNYAHLAATSIKTSKLVRLSEHDILDNDYNVFVGKSVEHRYYFRSIFGTSAENQSARMTREKRLLQLLNMILDLHHNEGLFGNNLAAYDRETLDTISPIKIFGALEGFDWRDSAGGDADFKPDVEKVHQSLTSEYIGLVQTAGGGAELSESLAGILDKLVFLPFSAAPVRCADCGRAIK